jgi:hypothetical protein
MDWSAARLHLDLGQAFWATTDVAFHGKGIVMKGFCKYIEAHHEEYGAGLFIVPVLAVIFIVFSVCCAVSALFAM